MIRYYVNTTCDPYSDMSRLDLPAAKAKAEEVGTSIDFEYEVITGKPDVYPESEEIRANIYQVHGGEWIRDEVQAEDDE